MTDEQLWAIIAKHYQGSIDPPSLLAQKMFAVACEIRDAVDAELSKQYEALDQKYYAENWKLREEIRQLKGLPPEPPIPMA